MGFAVQIGHSSDFTAQPILRAPALMRASAAHLSAHEWATVPERLRHSPRQWAQVPVISMTDMAGRKPARLAAAARSCAIAAVEADLADAAAADGTAADGAAAAAQQPDAAAMLRAALRKLSRA